MAGRTKGEPPRRAPTGARRRGTRYLDSPGGPILNLEVLAREILLEYIEERDLAPTGRDAADLLYMRPTTLNQILKGERGISAEKLSYPVAAIDGGDPGRFFQRHDLMRGADRSGVESKERELLAPFTPEERSLLLGRAADVKRLGPDAWAGFLDVLEALYRTATARRRRR